MTAKRKNGSDVLIMTYPGATFFEDSARGLAGMLGDIGLKASSAVLSGGSWDDSARRMIIAANPRLVVLVNMTRKTLMSSLRNVPVVATWRQDDCSELDGPAKAQAWIRDCPRDWVFGYTQPLPAWGYPEEKLIETPLFINPKEMEAEPSKGPALFLASNKGGDPFEALTKTGLERHPGIKTLAARLWTHYSAGRRLPNFEWLRAFCSYDQRTKELGELMANPRIAIMLYWQFAERIYRRAVASWMPHATDDWVVAGTGWPADERSPRRTPGCLPRRDLPAWRASSRWSLHLNGQATPHHGLVEILLSGGRPLAHGWPRLERPRAFSRELYSLEQERVLRSAFDAMLNRKSSGWRGDALDSYKDCVQGFETKDDLKELCHDAAREAREDGAGSGQGAGAGDEGVPVAT